MTHAITVRKIPFDFSNDISPHWHPKKCEWGHMINGASLTMPYLEPFLNRTLREALGKMSDSTLHQDVEGFIRQEAQHYANHRRYNEMLKANGYAVLADIEATFAADYAALEKRSLEWRLAYSAGFETMTMGITDWLVNERSSLFYGANPAVTSLVLWHMVEEPEHKAVAYDVYETLCGRYWLRIAELVWGSLHVGFMSRRAYRAMLQQDGVWNTVKGRIRIWLMVGRFFKNAGGAMLRALRPGYHPNQIADPPWVDQWRLAYAAMHSDKLPLLDTSQRDIPPKFGIGCANE